MKVQLKYWLKRICLSFIIGIACQTLAYATHIVGGEIVVEHIMDEEYLLSVNVYFDEVNGNPDARDPNVTVFVYQKSNDRLMDQFVLPLFEQEPVNYSYEKCAQIDPSLETSSIRYQTRILLPRSRFNSPDGYYFIFDRCCRNNIISNIVRPEDAGQLFYLEFPAVVKDGVPFINSSPSLFPPLSDFVCVGDPYSFSFGGEDPDGDSLVYSMSTPLNGYSTPNAPVTTEPQPAPYPEITFLSGFDKDNAVPGNPSLFIDELTGELNVTASNTGLYVFAIKCEEYRDGVKIGEVRRDFQMKVIDCPQYFPPDITPGPVTGSSLPYIEGQVITYVEGDEAELCIPLTISDSSATDEIFIEFKPISHESENNIELKALNFEMNPDTPISWTGDTLRAEICFPECVDIVDEIYEFEIIISDGSCPKPQTSSTTFTLLVEASPNQEAVAGSNTLTDLNSEGCFETSVLVGEIVNFDIFGIDPDGDSLRVVAFGSNVDLLQEGIVFDTVSDQASITASFEWAPTCDNLGPNNSNRDVEIFFIVEDYWKCGVKSRDTVCVNINVGPPPEVNNSPEISLLPALVETGNLTYSTTVYLGEDLTFDINALDIDNNAITLEALPQGFSFDQLGMEIDEFLEGVGNLSTTFTWTPDCADLLRLEQGIYEETFQIQFVAKDAYGCGLESQTIITVDITLIFVPDDNIPPVIAMQEADVVPFDPVLEVYCDTITLGEAYELNFSATDEDADELLFLEAIGQGFSLEELGIEFENQGRQVNGEPLTARFFWQPDCDALAALGGQDFIIDIITRDENTCKLSTGDTIRIKLRVEDIESPAVPPFPNAFSPNGDGISEAYIIRELPIDNCADEFLGIEIYNRWGTKVFESEERDFAWDGVDVPAGVYYYHIKYRNSDYKGTITLFRGGD